MNEGKAAFIVGGVSSGAGKTSVTLGLVRAIVRSGLTVQTFKAGPDYLDPMHLAVASGQPCFNLDGWMCGIPYCQSLCRDKLATSDVGVVEGVMGLFDGRDTGTITGSTAELAAELNLPVLLVVDAGGMARSIAPLVKGFAEFHESVHIAGIFANRCGSASHVGILADALNTAQAPPLVGYLLKDELPHLPSRHLGLVGPIADTDSTIDRIAETIGQRIDLDAWLSRCRIDLPPQSAPLRKEMDKPERIRLAIARDEAFSFYYQENLDALASAGAELIKFSPLHDTALPENLDAVYFGGGYPELHAASLSANASMREVVGAFARSGRVVYAECGGLMYLSESLQTLDGERFGMVGILPMQTRMLPRRKRLAMTEVTFRNKTPWGDAGERIRGHEFHFSEIVDAQRLPGPWQTAYNLHTSEGTSHGSEGFMHGNILCSYVHLYWASNPEAAAHFTQYCSEKR